MNISWSIYQLHSKTQTADRPSATDCRLVRLEIFTNSLLYPSIACSNSSVTSQVTVCCRQFVQGATTSRQRKDDIQLLIRSREPLTNDGGKLFGTAVVQIIMDFAGAEGTLQSISSGSEWSISYSRAVLSPINVVLQGGIYALGELG